MIYTQVGSINKKEESLLSRTLINAVIEFENATPLYKDVSALLAAQLKADEKLIAIRHVYNTFGTKKAQVTAYLYTDEAKKQFAEPKVKEKKEKKAKEAKKK